MEDEVKSERSGRRQDRDFQCNDHEMCDEEDDEIYDGDDASDEEDDQLCSSFGLEHQTPGRRTTTAKRCTMRHLPIVCLNRHEDESKRKRLFTRTLTFALVPFFNDSVCWLVHDLFLTIELC